MEVKQKSSADFIKEIFSSEIKLSLSAALLVILALVLPFISIQTNMGLGLDRAGSINAYEAAGLIAWVTTLAFIISVVSRFAHQLTAYKSLIDIAAIALAILTIVITWFFNPAVLEMHQATDFFGGSRMSRMVIIYPHIGMVLLIVASGVLLLARKRAISQQA